MYRLAYCITPILYVKDWDVTPQHAFHMLLHQITHRRHFLHLKDKKSHVPYHHYMGICEVNFINFSALN
jgi:hypothetical protein